MLELYNFAIFTVVYLFHSKNFVEFWVLRHLALSSSLLVGFRELYKMIRMSLGLMCTWQEPYSLYYHSKRIFQYKLFFSISACRHHVAERRHKVARTRQDWLYKNRSQYLVCRPANEIVISNCAIWKKVYAFSSCQWKQDG